MTGADPTDRNGPRADDGQLLRAHQVAIIVSVDSTSRESAAGTLGLDVVSEALREGRDPDKLDLWPPDGIQCELSSFLDPPRRPSDPEACGPGHLAFEVSDVDRAVGLPWGRGVAVEAVRVDEHTGKGLPFFAEPDGQPPDLHER